MRWDNVGSDSSLRCIGFFSNAFRGISLSYAVEWIGSYLVVFTSTWKKGSCSNAPSLPAIIRPVHSRNPGISECDRNWVKGLEIRYP